jgi:hypothetical protein
LSPPNNEPGWFPEAVVLFWENIDIAIAGLLRSCGLALDEMCCVDSWCVCVLEIYYSYVAV